MTTNYYYLYKSCLQNIPFVAYIHVTTEIITFKCGSIDSIVITNHPMFISPPNDNTCQDNNTIYSWAIF